MNDATQPWTSAQLTTNLLQLEQLLHHDCFQRAASFSSLTRTLFIELLGLEDQLLQQAQRAGKRIDFIEEVGTNGRIEDISSLVHHMSQSVYDFEPEAASNTPNRQIITPYLNHFYGAGVGYFTNGLFFTCPYEDELTFFVGRNRVFFYRHLVRAFNEARSYFKSILLDE